MSTWRNHLGYRLMMWALQLQSPSLGRTPTLREAFTGRIREWRY